MDERPFDSINVIPFVDIMLVLFTIVLTTSGFIASGRLPIHLPQASRSVDESRPAKVIELSAAGEIHFNGHPLSPQALSAALASLPRETAFVVRADKDVTLQRFIDVADVLKQLGFSRVAVQTQSG